MRDPKKIPDDIRAAAKYLHDDGYSRTFLRLLADAADELERAQKRDTEAATHVESVIAMRTAFTGNPPYVGWSGLGLALAEALDERDGLRAENERLTEDLERVARRAAWQL